MDLHNPKRMYKEDLLKTHFDIYYDGPPVNVLDLKGGGSWQDQTDLRVRVLSERRGKCGGRGAPKAGLRTSKNAENTLKAGESSTF